MAVRDARDIERHLRRLEQSREYKRVHRDQVLAQQRAYKQTHKERQRELWLSWYAQNRERVLERKRARDKTVIAAQAREWRARNREKVNRRAVEWNRAHPDVASIYANRRRVRLANAKGSHTPGEWAAAVAGMEGCCFWCRQQRPLTRDHLIPLSRGGSDDIMNIVPACKSCNSKKHDSDGLQYLARLFPDTVTLNGY